MKKNPTLGYTYVKRQKFLKQKKVNETNEKKYADIVNLTTEYVVKFFKK